MGKGYSEIPQKILSLFEAALRPDLIEIFAPAHPPKSKGQRDIPLTGVDLPRLKVAEILFQNPAA